MLFRRMQLDGGSLGEMERKNRASRMGPGYARGEVEMKLQESEKEKPKE